MKKFLLGTLALVMALTLILGSVTTASAAPPTKTPEFTFKITGADATTQTIYYQFSWKFPKDMAVSAYTVNFYHFEGSGVIMASTSKAFAAPKTSYSFIGTIKAGAGPAFSTFVSGELIQGQLTLFDAFDNPITGSYITTEYLVP